MPSRTKPNGSRRVVLTHNHYYILVKVDGEWIAEHRYIMQQIL